MENEQKKETPGKTIITPAGPVPAEKVHVVNKGESVSQKDDGLLEIIKNTNLPDAENTNTPNANDALLSVPPWIEKDHIVTPGGLRHKSLVHEITPEHILDESGGRLKKLDKNNKLIKDYGPVNQAAEHTFIPDNIMLPKKIVPGLGTGWITDADWTNNTGSPVSSFATTWVVPPPPSTQSALIYIFNGIQNSTKIYQPVLQWGNNGESGGNYWQVASWYAGSTFADSHHSPYVRVNPGDVLIGTMTLTAQSGSNFSYNCAFQGIANSGLTIQNVEQLTWCIETLEAYNVNNASDYPVRKIVMRNIDMRAGGRQVAVNWGVQNRVTDTGQQTVVINNNSLNEEVDLYCYTLKQITIASNADGRLEVFYTSINDALYHLWQGSPNGGWVTDVPLGNGNSAKQITVGKNQDGRLEIFYVGTNNNIYHNWQVAPNGNWAGESGLGGSAKQIVVGKNLDGRLEVFYIGTNDQLYHNWQKTPNGSWAGESSLGGKARSIVIGSNRDGRLELFYIGLNNFIYHNWQVVPNGGWSGEVLFGGTANQICIGQNADGRMELFYTTPNNAIYHSWQVVPNGGWSAAVAFGGFAKQLNIARNADGRMELFYIGTNNAIYHNWQTAPNNGWRGEVALGGFANQITAGKNADGRLELFYVGTNNALYHNWQVTAGGNWFGEQRS